MVASIPILFFGWLHLTLFVGNDPANAFMLGVAPFIVGDILKVSLSAGLVKTLKS
jgi:biotin transporter BioY